MRVGSSVRPGMGGAVRSPITSSSVAPGSGSPICSPASVTGPRKIAGHVAPPARMARQAWSASTSDFTFLQAGTPGKAGRPST